MAGKVGRSGRRSLSDEVVRAAVRHVTLDLSKLTKEQKTELALGRRSVKDFQHTG